MALIGKIRRNSWFLILMLALGMIAFLFMDMFGNGGSAFGGDPNTVGEIAGKKINIQEFEAKNTYRFGRGTGDTYAQKSAVWDMFVEQAVIEKEAEALGLTVSNEELNSLLFGPNYSPIIIRDFPNQNMRGIPNVEQINQIRESITSNTMNPQFAPFWFDEEKEVISDRLKTKISNMVAKGVFTPSWLVEMQGEMENDKVEMSYVKIPFSQIEDAAVEVNDADYSSYLTENKHRYEIKEPSVDISYIAFDVVASAADSLEFRNELSGLKTEFANSTSDSLFVDNNKGIAAGVYAKKSELNTAIADAMFDMPVGSVVGPYLEGRAYRIAKLQDRIAVPDSAQARHILISAAPTNPLGMVAARRTIDSLRTEIRKGASFATLAKEFSQDTGSGAKGGDLGMTGWPSPYVKPFTEAVYYQGNKRGDLTVVQSQFGVHLIEVMKTKSSGARAVKVAYLERMILPSKTTKRSAYQKADKFAGTNRSLESMKTAADADASISVETASNLKANDFFIQGISSDPARKIIKWATNDADAGNVSAEVYVVRDAQLFYDSKYVVAALNQRNRAGLPSVASIKDNIAIPVMNRKKGAAIISKIKGTDLASVASAFGTKVDSVQNVTFTSASVSGLGNEPEVVSKAFSMGMDKMSEPIVGNEGVYLVKVNNKISIGSTSDIASKRKQLHATSRSVVTRSMIPALKELTKIEDNRTKFY